MPAALVILLRSRRGEAADGGVTVGSTHTTLAVWCSVNPSERFITLGPDHTEGIGAVGRVIIHDDINKTVLNLAGFEAIHSIRHNDGNIVIFVLIGPQKRHNIGFWRSRLFHKGQEVFWYGLHRRTLS